MHPPRIEEILLASRKLNTLYDQLLAAVPERGQLWRDLCVEFRQKYDELHFPGGDTMLSAVRQQDPVAVETAVRFLLADPYYFRSGYLKQYLWQWLARIPLSQPQRTKLEQAALKYLERKVCREFWHMGKAMHRIARAPFWFAVAERVSSSSPERVRDRALLLLLFGADIHAGTTARRQIFERWLMDKFGGS